MYACAAKKDVKWIHAMGDSQQREFVAVMKMFNGTQIEATKFENADWIMDQSPNNLRITWQFYAKTFLWLDAKQKPRNFDNDKLYFDHYNIVPSDVSGC